MSMILRRQFPCECGSMSLLEWKTQVMDGVTVHNMPTYVCPECKHETYELRSAIYAEQKVHDAVLHNEEEITLEYHDVVMLEWDEPVPEELMKKIRAETGLDA